MVGMSRSRRQSPSTWPSKLPKVFMPVHWHHQGMKMTVRVDCPLSIFTAGHAWEVHTLLLSNGLREIYSFQPIASRQATARKSLVDATLICTKSAPFHNIRSGKGRPPTGQCNGAVTGMSSPVVKFSGSLLIPTNRPQGIPRNVLPSDMSWPMSALLE